MAEAAEAAAELEALLRAMEEDSARCEAATTRGAEEEAALMDAVAADSAMGENAKTVTHGVPASIRKKFEKFIENHGARLGYIATEGASVEFVEHFVDFCASAAGRQSFSCVGRLGMCDKYFELHLKCSLAAKVFPAMSMAGWTGLSDVELAAKAVPYREAIGKRWGRIKASRTDAAALGSSLAKPKWEDGMYFLAQDHWMMLASEHGRFNEACMALAVMGFVRATCSRAGSMGRDWFDRRGLTSLWVGRNVLNVGDYTWDKDHFVLTLPSVSEAEAASRLGAVAGGEAGEADEEREAASGHQLVQSALRAEVSQESIHVNRLM